MTDTDWGTFFTIISQLVIVIIAVGIAVGAAAAIIVGFIKGALDKEDK